MNRGRNLFKTSRLGQNYSVLRLNIVGATRRNARYVATESPKNSFGRVRTTSNAAGFTIVEVLIFLAVSAAMFVTAVLIIGGQQNKTEFTNTVRDFETRVTDIANDVSTGYYVRPQNFDCTVGPSGPVYSTVANKAIGTNERCVFIGTVLKFGTGPGTGLEKVTQFAVGGLRTTSTAVDVSSLSEAKPRVIDFSGAYTTTNIGSGVTIQCIAIGTGPCETNNNAAIGFFTTFNGTGLGTQGGGIHTDVLPYSAVNYNQAAAASINLINTGSVASALNPNGGVTICLKSGGTSQYALLQLGGGSASNLTIKSEIKSYGGSVPICS